MAQRQSTTTETQELKHLVLRLRNNAEAHFQQKIEEAQSQVETLNEGELSAFVDREFDSLNQLFLSHSDELRGYVKSKQPKEPIRAEFTSEDSFQQARTEFSQKVFDYKTLVAFAGVLVRNMMSWLADLFQKIHEFFRNLWTWIKGKFQDIAHRVKQFIDFVRERFQALSTYLFS